MSQENQGFIYSKVEEFFLLEDFAYKVNYIYHLEKTGELTREMAYETIGILCTQLEQSKKILSLSQSFKNSIKHSDLDSYN
jgi:hypothetical protein